VACEYSVFQLCEMCSLNSTQQAATLGRKVDSNSVQCNVDSQGFTALSRSPTSRSTAQPGMPSRLARALVGVVIFPDGSKPDRAEKNPGGVCRAAHSDAGVPRAVFARRGFGGGGGGTRSVTVTPSRFAIRVSVLIVMFWPYSMRW